MKSFPKICFLLLSALALSLPSFAQGRVSYGDTIFHANFGTGLNPDSVYRDFAAASLSPLNHISPLYGYYTPTWINGSELNACSGHATAFYGGDYSIISNSHAMAYNSSTGSAYSLYNANGCKSGNNNKYLVGCANFTDLPLLDHTSGDGDGGYMIVNGSTKAGAIFIREINEICKNSQFEFSAWVAYAHNSQLQGTQLQFEIYSDDPGDAILPVDDAAESLTPGPVEMIVKEGQDPVVRNLLYKSATFAPTATPGDTTFNRTVSEEISATTTTNEYGVFTDGAGNYAYLDASDHYFSTARVSGANAGYSVWYTFAEGGSRLYSSADFTTPVYVKTTTGEPVYLSVVEGDTVCYDSSADKYYLATRSGASLLKDTENEYDAANVSDQLRAYATNGVNSYPLYADGTGAYAVYDGANYLKLTAGTPANYASGLTTDVNVPSCTFSAALADQSSVFSTAYKYNSDHTTSVTVSNPRTRWTSFVDVFRLGNYEHCYLVLRNLNGGNKANDFAVDDIVFRPYSPFAIVPSRIEASVANACVTGIVSLKTSFAEGTTDEEKAAVAPYITDYGFRFQGSKDGGSTWKDLPGQETPLQLSDINATLEYDIPVSDYNSYNEFRIVVASTPAGFASKCVSFSSFNYDVESVSAIPDFYILGEDICVTDTNPSTNDTYGKECGLFKVVRKTDASDYATCSEHPFWQIIVQLPDGSTKTLVPDTYTVGNGGTTTYDNCSYD
ncbi:MAG: hypothetical protein IJR32_02970 [Paludibacteraceae bacterium]|nr:hypothetical protein [Paludibacteraceae bacterium]